MPPKKKKDSSKVEERWVTWDDLEAGVKAKAGHALILFLGGVAPGTPTGTPDPGDPSGPGPGDPSGPGPGNPSGPGTTPGDHSAPGPHTDPTDPGDHSAPGPHNDPTDPGDHSAPGPHQDPTAPGPHHDPTAPPPHHDPTAPPPPPVVKISSLIAEHFQTAKAFPLPFDEAIKAFRDMASLANSNSRLKLLILGHTDRAGGVDYNYGLSEERATTAKAFLKNDVDAWYAFYAHTNPQARWGMLEDQWMLKVAKDDSGTSYYARDASAVVNADFKAGLKRFQTQKKLPSTGTTDRSTRQALILNYMQTEGTTVPDSTSIESIGCGEQCNKVPTADGVANPDNRRVEIYAFPDAITPPTSQWSRSLSRDQQAALWHKWYDPATPIDGAKDNLSASEDAQDP